MPRKTGKTGPKTTDIAAAVGAPLPEADTKRLASQIAAPPFVSAKVLLPRSGSSSYVVMLEINSSRATRKV